MVWHVLVIIYTDGKKRYLPLGVPLFEFKPKKALRKLVIDTATSGWRVNKFSNLDGSMLFYLEGTVSMSDGTETLATLDLEADNDCLMVDLYIMGPEGLYSRNLRVTDKESFREVYSEVLTLEMVPKERHDPIY